MMAFAFARQSEHGGTSVQYYVPCGGNVLVDVGGGGGGDLRHWEVDVGGRDRPLDVVHQDGSHCPGALELVDLLHLGCVAQRVDAQHDLPFYLAGIQRAGLTVTTEK